MNVTKTAGYMQKAGAVALGTGLPLLAGGQVALAANGAWKDPNELIKSAGQEGSFEGTDVNGEWINTKVTSIAGWLLGIAVGLFVLRVILTAVDRMVLGGQDQYGNQTSVLSAIPMVGAYPPKGPDGSGYTWKDIWINFAKQMAICVGAWVLVNAVVGIVSWLMTSVAGA